MARRIAISGKMTSGKTTLSTILVEKYHYTKMAFADPLKQIAKTLTTDPENLEALVYRVCLNNPVKTEQCLNILLDDIYPKYKSHSIETKDNITRALFQELGQKLKAIDSNLWVNYLVANLPDDKIVVDDLRFRQELNALETEGFLTIRLEITPEAQRERIEKLYGTVDENKLTDISEVDLDHAKFDYVIDATQSLQQIEEELDNILRWNWHL